MSLALSETIIDVEQEEALVEEICGVISLGALAMREMYVCLKWTVGKKVANDPQYQKLNGGRGSASYLKRISARMRDGLTESQQRGWSDSEIYRCVQFYEKLPGLNLSQSSEGLMALPEGMNISWSLIKRRYLPEHPASTEEPSKPSKAKPNPSRIVAHSQQRIGQVWTTEDHAALRQWAGYVEFTHTETQRSEINEAGGPECPQPQSMEVQS